MQRVDLTRWVAKQIIELGIDIFWVEKALLHFTTKSWWTIVRQHLSPTSTENMLTCDRVELIASLIAGYDIDFPRWIRAEKAFYEFITLPFPCLVQRLCDAAGVPTTLDVDRRFKATSMVNIGFVMNASNPIMIQKAQSFTSSGAVYFEGPFISAKQVERPTLVVDIDTSNQWVEPSATTSSEKVVGTSALSSASTLSPRPPVKGFVSVPQDFLFQLVDQLQELNDCPGTYRYPIGYIIWSDQAMGQDHIRGLRG